MDARTGHKLGYRKPPCDVVIPDLVEWEDGLSEEEAVAVGLWNNPAFQELLADLEITHADVIEASQIQNPEVDTIFPLGPKQWEFVLKVPLDVIWLRPLRVAAAQLESGRVAERLVQDGLNVVRDVRVAYVDWQLAIQRLELAQEGVRLRNDITRIAEARLKAGAVGELDVSAMRLESLFGQEEVIRAARAVDLARDQLRFLLGIEFTDFLITPARMAAVPSVELDTGNLVGQTVASRPDLVAARLACSAAQERARLARRNYWNIVGYLPDLNSRGRKGFEAGPGLQFNVPIFHQNQGAIARAEADRERLRRQYVKMRDTAALEVRQAHTRLLQANDELRVWREQIVPEAQSAVTSARQALQEDGVSLLLVLETSRQLLNARQRELEAAAELRRAVAELERSVGRRLFGAASSELGAEEIVPPAPDSDAEKNIP